MDGYCKSHFKDCIQPSKCNLSVLVAGGAVSLVYEEEEVTSEAVEYDVMNNDVMVLNDDSTIHTILSPIRVPFTPSQMKLPTKLLPW